jgi:hypothetical protein
MRHDKDQRSSSFCSFGQVSSRDDVAAKAMKTDLESALAYSGILRPGRYLTFSCFSLKSSTSERPSLFAYWSGAIKVTADSAHWLVVDPNGHLRLEYVWIRLDVLTDNDGDGLAPCVSLAKRTPASTAQNPWDPPMSHLHAIGSQTALTSCQSLRVTISVAFVARCTSRTDDQHFLLRLGHGAFERVRGNLAESPSGSGQGHAPVRKMLDAGQDALT